MIIKFLGTSAGWPLPRLGCDCEICTSKDPKDKRTRSSVLIDGQILIDSGPDIYHQLISNNPEKIHSVLITHGHPDHILGLHDLGHIYNRKADLKIFTPQPVINQIKRKFDYNLAPLKFIPVREEEVFEIGLYHCFFFPVEHVKQATYGVKIKRNKFFGYIPDFAKLPKRSEYYIKDAHLLVLDGSSLGKIGQSRSHINIEQGIELAKKLKAKQVFFTHIGHKTGCHNELEKILQIKAGKNYQMAFDGLIIELD